MDRPTLKGRVHTAHYGLMMTPLMKETLREMKVFYGIDTSQRVRDLIQKEIDEFKADEAFRDQRIVAVMSLPRGKD